MTQTHPMIQRNHVFYITPHIQGLDMRDDTARTRLVKLLDALEPHGAQGNVQLGYTLGLDIYDYYVEDDNTWTFDSARLNKTLTEAAKINRPFVLYLKGTHFFGGSAYAQHLLSLPKTSMRYADGSVPSEQYFRTTIAPFRISNNTSLEHVDAKFNALSLIGKKLAAFNITYPDLLIATTLNGETHYMFEDFFGGMGEFSNTKFTDFSNNEIEAFQNYLNANHLDHQASNMLELDTNTYPWGSYPFFGWACLEADEQIIILREGEFFTQAETGLNRLDVYEAIPDMQRADCGFRADINFSDWTSGTHHLQAVIKKNDDYYALANSELILQIDSNDTPAHRVKQPHFKGTRQGYVDRGNKTPVHVTYHPLAKHWVDFRAYIIESHIDHMANILAKQGIPRSKIFSYQLPSWLNGDWNNTLFGIGKEFFFSTTLQAGITLYGGNTMSETIYTYLANGRPYAIPEFHIQMDKLDGTALKAMQLHQGKGATFLAPYFMNIAHDDRPASDHDDMLIAPGNTSRGSDDMYRAIREIVQE